MSSDVLDRDHTPNRRAFRARLLSPSVLVCCLLGLLDPFASPATKSKIITLRIKLPVVQGNDISFIRFSPSDGLSQIRVSEIVQDNQGFMWFGTEYGLNRYDGYSFKVFAHDPRNPNSLSGAFIEALFKDRSGALWVSSGQFLNKFDLLTETFRRFPIQLVNHISQDRAGKLWLATGRGLYSLEESTGEIRQFTHDPSDPSTLASNDIKWSGEDRQSGFWVANSEGLDKFDRQTGKVTLHIPLHEPLHEFGFYEDSRGVFWIFHVSGEGLAVLDRENSTLTQYSFHDRPPSSSAITGVKALLEDRNGNLWIGTQGNGLLRFDREHNRFIAYRHKVDDPESLAEDSVNTLYEDREGNIWAALGAQGLNRFSVRPLPFRKLPYDARRPYQKGETMVNAITGDRRGILWTSTREALNRIDLKNGEQRKYEINDVVSLAVDRKGILWAGTYNDGLSRLDPQTSRVKVYRHNPTDPGSVSNDIVTRLLLDHSGTLWAATYDGLNRFDASTERFTTYKLDPKRKDLDYIELVEDRLGMLWLGTHSEGLQRFDPRTGQFTAYAHEENRPDSLSDDRVNSILFDRSGGMWVGTQNGFDRFNASTSTFTAYAAQDGLAGNAVSCILEDDSGDLWIGTNNGISRFRPSTETFKNFSRADGLPGLDLTGWGACYKDPDGEMFFGGFSGGTAFFPEQVRGNTYSPPVVLTDFRLFGNSVGIGDHSPLAKSISYTSEITLSHKQNVFGLIFAALSYSDPAGNRYRYKLEGLDREWTEAGSDRRSATYTTLPAGNYTFRVQGATSSGAYAEPGLALRIRVLPPWWGTWWFRALCAAVFLAFAWTLHQFRIWELRQREKKLRQVIETIPTFAWTALPDGSVDFVNRHWKEYTGLSTEKTLGSGWEAVVHPQDLKRHAEKWRASVASAVPFENEVRYWRAADGQYRWFLTRAVPLRDARGKIVKWYGSSTDIEDRKRAEQLQADLAHINRVNTIGEMTASLAHEIKQPIGATVVNADACLRWLASDQPHLDEIREAASSIVKDGKRAGDVIDRIRALYKKAPPQRQLVDVNETISEIVVLLRGEANRYAVSMRTDLAADLPKITADRVQLQQLFMNLMLNGIEAMEETGGVLKVKSQLSHDGGLLISVSDTGVGLPIEKADQIFNAFFTTKPQGSGMGLAISRSIVEAHGGRLWATANSARGATFHFTLPTTTEVLQEAATGT